MGKRKLSSTILCRRKPLLIWRGEERENQKVEGERENQMTDWLNTKCYNQHHMPSKKLLMPRTKNILSKKFSRIMATVLIAPNRNISSWMKVWTASRNI
jgi:hypothetical protein